LQINGETNFFMLGGHIKTPKYRTDCFVMQAMEGVSSDLSRNLEIMDNYCFWDKTQREKFTHPVFRHYAILAQS
jgi:hypothetical protein